MLAVKASALDRIMNCAGSVALAKQAPAEVDTDDAQEGIAAHWVAAEMLRDPAREWLPGAKTPGGILADTEMLQHSATYARFLAGFQHVEEFVTWGSELFEVRCKIDAGHFNPDDGGTLAVGDFKYGYRFIPVACNWQLLAGALGLAMKLKVRPKRFRLFIYQPRVGEAFRSVDYCAEEMLEYHKRIVHRICNLTDELRTGAHCRYCPARAHCPATQRAGYNAVDVAMNAGALNVAPDEWANEVDILNRAAEVLKQRIAWLEGSALDTLKSGKPVPGFFTKTALGNTTWIDGADAELRKIDSETNHTLFDEKPCTPAEAKRRGLSDADYKRLTTRPAKGLKLVRGDPADDAKKAFGP